MKIFNLLKRLGNLNLIRFFNLAGKDRKLIAALALFVFFTGNLMVSFLSLRYDLSYGNAYTLSQSTKKILSNLDDVVTIKFFVSSELPNQLAPLKTDVIDLLNEYKKFGGSKLNLRVLDPKKDENAKNEAAQANIPELQFSQIEKDKYAVTSAQFGVLISYADKKETIPQVTNIENLEYNITSAIYKMTKKNLAKVGIIGYEPSFSPQEDQIGPIKALLERQFMVDYVDISTASGIKNIDKSYGALMVFDNRQKQYSEPEIKLIKDYLNNKGNAVIFLDGVWVMDDLSTQPSGSGLSKLIDDYGISVSDNLILSTSSELVNFGNSTISFMAPYPYWLKTNAFDNQSSYFSNITQLTYPWVSSINIIKKDGYDVKSLVKSTSRSWEQSKTYTLTPESIKEPNPNDLKDFTITAQSVNKNKGKIVVISTSRFILSQYLSRSSGNAAFVVNSLSEMAAGGELSGMSQRAVQFYPIPDMSEQNKDLFKYANMLLLPLLFGILGGYRLMKRR